MKGQPDQLIRAAQGGAQSVYERRGQVSAQRESLRVKKSA